MRYPPWNQQQKHLKMDAWKINFLFGRLLFRGEPVNERSAMEVWGIVFWRFSWWIPGTTFGSLRVIPPWFQKCSTICLGWEQSFPSKNFRCLLCTLNVLCFKAAFVLQWCLQMFHVFLSKNLSFSSHPPTHHRRKSSLVAPTAQPTNFRQPDFGACSGRVFSKRSLCVWDWFSGQETTGQYLTWDIPPAEVPVDFFGGCSGG